MEAEGYGPPDEVVVTGQQPLTPIPTVMTVRQVGESYVPPPPGATLVERMLVLKNHLDDMPCPGCKDGVALLTEVIDAAAAGARARVQEVTPEVDMEELPFT